MTQQSPGAMIRSGAAVTPTDLWLAKGNFQIPPHRHVHPGLPRECRTSAKTPASWGLGSPVFRLPLGYLSLAPPRFLQATLSSPTFLAPLGCPPTLGFPPPTRHPVPCSPTPRLPGFPPAPTGQAPPIPLPPGKASCREGSGQKAGSGSHNSGPLSAGCFPAQETVSKCHRVPGACTHHPVNIMYQLRPSDGVTPIYLQCVFMRL